LKINKEGYVFASGPGGILVLNSKGKLLGRLRLKEPASNCALSPDQKTLYITNNTRIIKWTLRK
jgi:gluconolactonase